MVGYQKDDTITVNQKLIAGCVSGCATRFITQPLDVIKVRTQLQKGGNKDWYTTTTKIFREEGITAFWHGHNLGQIHSVLSVSSQFYVFEVATKYASTAYPDPQYKYIKGFVCGVIAGSSSAAFILPVEVIRVRQIILKEQYKGLMKGAMQVYKSGGILAFYEGLSASILQMGPQVGISFSVFGFVQPLILKTFAEPCTEKCMHPRGNAHNPELLVVASSIAGSAAGLVSKCLTYPFELAKRRLQIASHKVDKQYQIPSTVNRLQRCHSLKQCLKSTVKTEGFFGLYRGCSVAMYKAQITSIMAFTTYEFVCYLIRKIDS